MGKVFHKFECHVCGKRISECGLGKISHYKMHFRNDEMDRREYPPGQFFYSKGTGQTFYGYERK